MKKGNSFATRDNFSVHISGGGRLEIGDNVFFNCGCSINVMKAVEIGNDCIFGENVCFYDHNHKINDKNTKTKDSCFTTEKIIIENNVWIGSNVTILKGVKISNNCVIGAGCVVYRDLPDDTILLCNGTRLKRGENR